MGHSADCLAQNTLFGEPGPPAKKAKAAPKTPNPCHGAALEPVQVPDTHYAVRFPFTPSGTQLLRYQEELNTTLKKTHQHQPVKVRDGDGYRVSFGDDALAKLREKHPSDPIYAGVESYRILQKAVGTYLNKLRPTLPDGRRNTLMGPDGRLHDSFRHTPVTMRLAMEMLQVLPRPERGQLAPSDPRWIYNAIRQAFVPAPGRELVAADYCVDPATKILKADLTWDKAENIAVGDELIGFDDFEKMRVQYPETGTMKGRTKYRASTVVAVDRIRSIKVRVNTSEGSTIVSSDHKFACRTSNKTVRKWVRASELKAGTFLSFISKPWETNTSWEGGYLAGFFDGEGWVSGPSVGWGQNTGPTCTRVKEMLHRHDYPFTFQNNSSSAECWAMSGLYRCLRFMGEIRPPRLMLKQRQLWEGRMSWSRTAKKAEVLSVEPVEDGDVIAIQTTTGTYISDGFFSHNCAVEPLLVSYFAKDAAYMRACKLGSHDWFTAFMVGSPVDILNASDEDVRNHFAALRRGGPYRVNGDLLPWKAIRDGCKTTHMASLYAGGPGEIARANPGLFKTNKDAAYIQDAFFDLAPSVKRWHWDTAEAAERDGYLTTPIGLRLHYFGLFDHRYSQSQNKWVKSLSREAKKCIAAMPQHTGMMYLATAATTLADERPDLAECMRLLIHDEILSEPTLAQAEEFLTTLVDIMERPHPLMPLWPEAAALIGESHLSVAVESKRSTDAWGSMK